MPNSAVATRSMIRNAPERLRSAKMRSGSSECRLRRSMSTNVTRSTANAVSEASTFESIQCEIPRWSVPALDRPYTSSAPGGARGAPDHDQ